MEINRLRWAIRRGMLELDLVFQPFLENEYSQLDQRSKDLFVKLLECEDQEMFKWFLKKEDPSDPDILEIVNIIRSKTGLQDYS